MTFGHRVVTYRVQNKVRAQELKDVRKQVSYESINFTFHNNILSLASRLDAFGFKLDRTKPGTSPTWAHPSEGAYRRALFNCRYT